ncbi:ADP-dependent NAD(P)H-hydrate dehydratase [Microbacterium sp. MC2]
MATLPLFTAAVAARHLRAPTASDDKYSRGVLGVRTGSQRYPGAAVLGVEAAWRTGLGMVRYTGPASALVLARRPETVTVAGRVQTWLIGSGTDADHRTPAETAALREILAGEVPVVVDAGALDLVPGATAPVLVTPHAGEHARLRRQAGLAADDDRVRACVQTAAELGVAVLLKGSDTLVATPGGWIAHVAAPTSWLATAGTGDVLGGIVGALVAGAQAAAEQKGGRLTVEDLGAPAATAALLHGAAAQRASAAHAGGPVVALDVAHHVAAAVGALLSARQDGSA